MVIMSLYEFVVESNKTNSQWDIFLENLPGNNYLQTSLWGRVNFSPKWHIERVIAWQDNQIIAGSQIMFDLRNSSFRIGYISNGPILKNRNKTLINQLLKELTRLAEARSVHKILIQPANNVSILENDLIEFGFQPSKGKMELEATVLINLSLELDSILNGMKNRTRYNIRHSSRLGIKVIEGNKKYLKDYYQLVKKTSKRKDFSQVSMEFLVQIWDVFSPQGFAKLFFSMYDGEIVSGQLVLVFGDTVINKLSAWSGKHANRKPNEALQWHIIKWAKENGYLWLDLNGINPNIAKNMLSNDCGLKIANKSFTSFKIGFGGRILQLPGVYEINTAPACTGFISKILQKVNLFKGS